MEVAVCNLSVKSYEPGNGQGFTLIEMLIALAVIALLMLAAQPMLKLSFQQIKQVYRQQSSDGIGLGESVQRLENDVLQMRGDLPVRWIGMQDSNSCLTSWEFTTENQTIVGKTGIPQLQVRWRMEQKTLYREILEDGKIVASRALLNGIECIHFRFYQRQRWWDKPQPHAAIKALELSINWYGPTVVRVWPVNITYETE